MSVFCLESPFTPGSIFCFHSCYLAGVGSIPDERLLWFVNEQVHLTGNISFLLCSWCAVFTSATGVVVGLEPVTSHFPGSTVLDNDGIYVIV